MKVVTLSYLVLDVSEQLVPVRTSGFSSCLQTGYQIPFFLKMKAKFVKRRLEKRYLKKQLFLKKKKKIKMCVSEIEIKFSMVVRF
jgi:hypothetical protein